MSTAGDVTMSMASHAFSILVKKISRPLSPPPSWEKILTVRDAVFSTTHSEHFSIVNYVSNMSGLSLTFCPSLYDSVVVLEISLGLETTFRGSLSRLRINPHVYLILSRSQTKRTQDFMSSPIKTTTVYCRIYLLTSLL